MGKFFTKTFKPSVVNGDVSTVIQANADDLAFTAKDILFDWHALDIPRGTNAIVDGTIHAVGEDGGEQTDVDIILLIAKSLSGVAPTSLGAVNAARTGCFELPQIIQGTMKFEGDTNQQGIQHIAFGSIWQFNSTGNGGDIGPIIIEPEDMDFAGGQTQRIYVAGIAGGAIDFSTGVLLNDASDIADDAGTALTTDGVDPRKCFQVGDVIYIHDVDTSIGTVASMTATNITLTANNVGAIADDDEFVGDTPITIKLGFSKS